MDDQESPNMTETMAIAAEPTTADVYALLLDVSKRLQVIEDVFASFGSLMGGGMPGGMNMLGTK